MRWEAGVGVAVVAILAAAGPVAAQEVRWRTDYTAARKEAASTGRPLLLDFGTESCFWCKKLDATTFRDRAVAATLNDQFIPVKVDAERTEWLAQAVAVESYPTLVLVSPEGKVIARHEGYADAAQMTTFLGQAVPRNTSPTPPARPPVTELLALARADHDAGRYLACIEKCDRLTAGYPTSPEAAEARRLTAGIAADPQKWRRVTAQIETDLATLHQNLDAALRR